MEKDRAAEHLQVIRTLMERSALYRRALAPVMTLAGVLGTFAAVIGLFFQLETPLVFIGYWLAVGILTALSALLLVRQQALKQKEAFWTSPTRRVAHAVMPAMLVGFMIGAGVLLMQLKLPRLTDVPADFERSIDFTWLPLIWVVFYGCAIHAAGFFTPRGLRWFGWIFVIGGSLVIVWFFVSHFEFPRPQRIGHLLMGFFFGALHLAYGAYLSFTEKGKNAA
jgi:hypothetical protein